MLSIHSSIHTYIHRSIISSTHTSSIFTSIYYSINPTHPSFNKSSIFAIALAEVRKTVECTPLSHNINFLSHTHLIKQICFQLSQCFYALQLCDDHMFCVIYIQETSPTVFLCTWSHTSLIGLNMLQYIAKLIACSFYAPVIM